MRLCCTERKFEGLAAFIQRKYIYGRFEQTAKVSCEARNLTASKQCTMRANNEPPGGQQLN